MTIDHKCKIRNLIAVSVTLSFASCNSIVTPNSDGNKTEFDDAAAIPCERIENAGTDHATMHTDKLLSPITKDTWMGIVYGDLLREYMHTDHFRDVYRTGYNDGLQISFDTPGAMHIYLPKEDANSLYDALYYAGLLDGESRSPPQNVNIE